MSFVEVFEYDVYPGNDASLKDTCEKFARAAEAKIETLENMQFMIAKDDPSIMWQILHWKNAEAPAQAAKIMFSLPQMGALSIFMQATPMKLHNFETIS